MLKSVPDDPDEAARRFAEYLDRSEWERKRLGRLLALLFIVGIAALVIKVDFKALLLERNRQRPSLAQLVDSGPDTVSQLPFSTRCDASLPPNGRRYIFADLLRGSASTTTPRLELVNKHGYPIVVQINSRDQRTPFQAISLYPKSTHQLQIPAGSYGLTIMVGSHWCNIQRGFLDGKKIPAKKPLELSPNTTKRLNFTSRGPAPKDILLTSEFVLPERKIAAKPPEPPIMYGNGSIGIRRQPNGSYYVNGTINDVPTRYQIDTGASTTSVPREVAYRAGMYSCKSTIFHTANGTAIGCVGIARELSFGSFRIQNVEVAAMPNLKDSLLGMNVLKHLRMEQSGDVMRLSTNGTAGTTSYYPSAKFRQAASPKPTPPSVQERESVQARFEESEDEKRERCYKEFARIRDLIDERMRHGYSSAEGERLRERERQNELAYRECRG